MEATTGDQHDTDDGLAIASDYAIELESVSKRYGSVAAVNQLSLAIKPGTTFGLLGPNGAGKSTTIRMLVGLSQCDQGRISILGRDSENRTSDLKQRVGYVPEIHHLYRWMKVAEIVDFASSFYPTWDSELRDDLIEMFELPPDRKVKALSKGMTSKLGLLLALAHRPEVLILDEPTSGLDPLVREEFIDGVLMTGGESNRTTLFSSHHVDDVERIADEIGIMFNGQLIMHESVDDMRSRVKRIRAVLKDGSLPRSTPEQAIWQKVNRREWDLTIYPFADEVVKQVNHSNPIEQIDVIDLSLEEIFKDAIRGKKAAGQRK